MPGRCYGLAGDLIVADDAGTADTGGVSFEVTLVRDGAVDRLNVVGELDIATARLLEAKLHAVRPRSPVVPDMTAVAFIDSSGLRAILNAHEMLGDRLRIAGASAQCMRLFEITACSICCRSHSGIGVRSVDA